MASFSVQLLSGSPGNGRLVPITTTASPGTLIHDAVSGVNSYDELYLYASNVTGAAVTLTLEWGGLATADQLVGAYSIPAHSPPLPIALGLRINNALAIRAFASTANAINISGTVNRIE